MKKNCMGKSAVCGLFAVAVVLGALPGCSSASSDSKKTEITVDETKTADVIVAGAGGGGLSAAIAAVENGAESVLVLEKTGTTGGSLNYTSGSMSGAETVIQAKDGITDTVDSYVEDIMSNGGQLGNEELIRVYAEEDIPTIQWLWDNGLSDYKFSVDKATGTMSVFAPEHQLYSEKRTYKPSVKNSEKYKSAAHEILDTVAKSNEKITFDFSTTAKELVFNDKKRLTGVLAECNGKTIEYIGNKGVIMATGGYSGNQTLMAQFTDNGGNYLTGGADTADGYGIYMMQEVGAAMDKEQLGWIPTFPMGLDTGSGPGKIASTYLWKTGGICVNKEGKRFTNETGEEVVERETALEEQTEAIQYDIFTDNIIKSAEEKNASVFWNFFYEPGKPYNSFVISAPSIEELAEKIGVPADALSETITDYNEHVRSGKEDEFGRKYTEDALNSSYNVAINPVEGDTYYAVPLHALCVMTLGGAQINEKAQVLDTKHNVIPGLYAVGECTGGIWGKYVSGGTGVMGPIVFGRIAGKAIMEETPAEGYKPEKSCRVLKEEWFEKKVDENEETLTFDMTKTLKDGTYESTVDGQEGEMTVEVEIKDGKIADVKIKEAHESSFTEDAQKTVPAEIVKNNSIEVDNVSGATLTSGRIKQAVYNCLMEAAE